MVGLAIVIGVRLYRQGLAQALAPDPRFRITTVAATPAEVFDSLRRDPPDIALVDAPPQRLRAVVRELREHASEVRVVALAVPDNGSAVLAYAEAGISGYVTTEGSLAVLTEMLCSVARGEMPCTPRVAAMLLHRVGALAGDREDGDDGHARLTARELEIVRLLDEGLSNKEIATRLCIQANTVKNHVHNILGKLELSRRDEAARWGRRTAVRL
jgi:two-component system, NarL family, nitrate/nitrite response regulator NarL